jgi:hypothetical protein
MRNGGIKKAGYAEPAGSPVSPQGKHEDAALHLSKFKPGFHHAGVAG